MNIKNNLLIVFLVVLLHPAFAKKTVKISGVIVDKQTKEVMPFVNIRVAGTLQGTASDYEGYFELEVDSTLKAKRLYFSAIGYNATTISIGRYLKYNISTINLEPKTYGIEGIVISTESKVLYKIIKDATDNISSNYFNQPISYKALYQCEYFEKDSLLRKRDALVNISDANGYGNRNNAFLSVNYNFENVYRNFDIENLIDGTTMMDELLDFDIVRNANNVLNSEFLFEYDLTLESEEIYNYDSVWVIGYQLSNPELSRSGDYYAEIYQGRIYISKSTNAVYKNEVQIKSSKYSLQGRSMVADSTNYYTDVTYNCTTTYQNTGNALVLSRINLTKDFITKSKQPGKNVISLRIINTETTNPRLIENRCYYEDMISDPDFWLVIKDQINME